MLWEIMETASLQNMKIGSQENGLSPSTHVSRAKSMAPFALSLALHGAFAGAMLFSFGSKVVNMPIGAYRFGDSSAIELVSIPAAKPQVAKATPARELEGDIIVAKKEKKIEPAPTPEPTLAKTEAEASSNMAPVLGAGFADGTSTAAGPLGHENGVEVGIRERYLYELRRVIANRKTYPTVSRRLGETGRVVVKFVVDKSGKIGSLGLHTPSHHSRLNDAAVKLVSQIDQFKPFPTGESAESLSVEVPIDYVLN